MSVDTQIKFARQGKIYFWTLMMDSLARKKKKKTLVYAMGVGICQVS
jgi:hypothetical protein